MSKLSRIESNVQQLETVLCGLPLVVPGDVEQGWKMTEDQKKLILNLSSNIRHGLNDAARTILEWSEIIAGDFRQH